MCPTTPNPSGVQHSLWGEKMHLGKTDLSADINHTEEKVTERLAAYKKVRITTKANVLNSKRKTLTHQIWFMDMFKHSLTHICVSVPKTWNSSMLIIWLVYERVNLRCRFILPPLYVLVDQHNVMQICFSGCLFVSWIKKKQWIVFNKIWWIWEFFIMLN